VSTRARARGGGGQVPMSKIWLAFTLSAPKHHTWQSRVSFKRQKKRKRTPLQCVQKTAFTGHLAEDADGKRRFWVVRGSQRSPVEALQSGCVLGPRRRHGRRMLVRGCCYSLLLGICWPTCC
jgi:hypothetical protein